MHLKEIGLSDEEYNRILMIIKLFNAQKVWIIDKKNNPCILE